MSTDLDRFVALLTDAPNLRDVIWFPLMKPLTGEEEAGEEEEAEEE